MTSDILLVICTASVLIGMIILYSKIDSVRWTLMELEHKNNRRLTTPDEPVAELADAPETPDVPHDVLTNHELFRLEKEAEFDLRIGQIKRELDAQQVERKGTEAESLHPGVFNLPHNIIPDNYDLLPDVEIAD